MDVPQQEDQRCSAEGSKAPSIFQLANQEFEGSELESESTSRSGGMLLKHPELRTSEEAPRSPRVRLGGAPSSEGSDVPRSPSSGPSEQVAAAIEDMKRLMEEFGVDLATVTQAFLKTSGEVTAVAHCLQQTGSPSEDCLPLWTRQDDLDLLAGDDHLRSKLRAKYGEENVNSRVAFRKT
ncbi:telomeric repeat-binding factor 2-interacting protein 1 [Heteronotia binoei]|uniref:telomeric repeat-binding factor 2-interacting protein 1 n=1 Tax=Heteronotia binoei TaxID=13085 RepID=UPI00292DE0B1|nr:telomeric repeat-binding factor 2-interacting protein 1 [Heteronotia binoei]